MDTMRQLLKNIDQSLFHGRLKKYYKERLLKYYADQARKTGKKFHYYFYNSHLYEDKWMGVDLTQNPLDMWVKQSIIWETKPDLIIETGTLHGGSALFYAYLFEIMGHGKIITVDWAPQIEKVSQYPLFQKRVTSIKGETDSPEVIKKVKDLTGSAKAMVILDSNHTKEHVLKELNAYSPLVAPGKYLIVEDTNVNGHPVLPKFGPGPYEAVKTFLKNRTDFEIDRSREKFCVSFFPSGFLKRVKA